MKLKLIKGRSYNAKGVKVTADKPFFETDNNKLANTLIDSGHFIVIDEQKNNSLNTSKEIKEKPIDKMTEKELDDYAKEKEIDLTSLTKKADKLAKILENLKVPDDENDGENDNKVDFDGEV